MAASHAPARSAPAPNPPEPDAPEPDALEPVPAVVGADDPSKRRGPFRPARLAPVRERLSGPTLARVFRGLDYAVVVAVSIAVAALQAPGGLLAQPFGTVLPLVAIATAALWALASFKAYGFSQRETLRRHIGRVGGACGAAAVTGVAVSALTDHGALAHALALAGAVLAGLAGVHLWAWTSVRRWRGLGRLTPNVVVVGATANAARLIESALASREVNVLGIFDDRGARSPTDMHGVPVLGDTHALLEHKILPFVDRIVITVTASAQTRVRALIEQLKVLPTR